MRFHDLKITQLTLQNLGLQARQCQHCLASWENESLCIQRLLDNMKLEKSDLCIIDNGKTSLQSKNIEKLVFDPPSFLNNETASQQSAIITNAAVTAAPEPVVLAFLIAACGIGVYTQMADYGDRGGGQMVVGPSSRSVGHTTPGSPSYIISRLGAERGGDDPDPNKRLVGIENTHYDEMSEHEINRLFLMILAGNIKEMSTSQLNNLIASFRALNGNSSLDLDKRFEIRVMNTQIFKSGPSIVVTLSLLGESFQIESFTRSANRPDDSFTLCISSKEKKIIARRLNDVAVNAKNLSDTTSMLSNSSKNSPYRNVIIHNNMYTSPHTNMYTSPHYNNNTFSEQHSQIVEYQNQIFQQESQILSLENENEQQISQLAHTNNFLQAIGFLTSIAGLFFLGTSISVPNRRNNRDYSLGFTRGQREFADAIECRNINRHPWQRALPNANAANLNIATLSFSQEMRQAFNRGMHDGFCMERQDYRRIHPGHRETVAQFANVGISGGRPERQNLSIPNILLVTFIELLAGLSIFRGHKGTRKHR